MRVRATFPVGPALILLGLLIGLAGSFADNLLGDGALVTVFQVLLWLASGTIVLAGAASRVALRTGQRAGAGHQLRSTQ